MYDAVSNVFVQCMRLGEEVDERRGTSDPYSTHLAVEVKTSTGPEKRTNARVPAFNPEAEPRGAASRRSTETLSVGSQHRGDPRSD